jgi:acetyl-CoA C-acetyltransferase
MGRLLGGLARLSAVQIGSQVAKQLMTRAKVNPAHIDEVFIGQVLQAGAGQNPARQVALNAGVPDTVSAVTVNKVCGSGLQAVMFADQAIRAGDAQVVLAGGMESMTNAPFYIRNMRAGHKFGNTELIDGMQHDGLTDAYDGTIMGAFGDYTASKGGVSRKEQDEWAYRSHQRAAKAEKSGAFFAERVAVETIADKEQFLADENVRSDVSLEKLATLKPAFGKEGTVTAGNSSPLTDGAAMSLIASEEGLKRIGLQPMARIVSQHTSGAAPRDVFFTPIEACKKLCEKAGWDMRSVDLWEINEAFAAQTVACCRALEIDAETLNVNGGAVALGHPIGASGTRLLVTLLHALKARGGKRGVVSLCLGGGNAVAVALEMV